MKNDNNDIVFHYCSVETFFRIIESKVLRLSDSEHMNDEFEGKWVDKVFENLTIPKNSIIPDDFKKRYEQIIAKKQYIFCLSENGDKLSQWRGYGDDGKGISIGFSKNALGLSGIVNEVDDLDILTSKSGFSKMIYSEEEQENLLQEILGSITQSEHINSRLMLIKELSNRYKNPSFEEEQEVRIVYIPDNSFGVEDFTSKISKLKYRVSDQNIISYYIFKLTDEDTIPKVILGPKCTLNKHDLKQFLQHYGFSKTEIQKSISSYR